MNQDLIGAIIFACGAVSALSLALIAVNLEKIAKELKRRNDMRD